MENNSIEICLLLPVSLYQELAIEADRNATGISAEIISRLGKTFQLDALEQELHQNIERLKHQAQTSHHLETKNANGSNHAMAIQNEEMRIIMAKMERLQKDLLDIKNIVQNKMR